VKVGFAAQDIPLSRIELEFAEQHAKELGWTRSRSSSSPARRRTSGRSRRS
jgi:hypothetical protein